MKPDKSNHDKICSNSQLTENASPQEIVIFVMGKITTIKRYTIVMHISFTILYFLSFFTSLMTALVNRNIILNIEIIKKMNAMNWIIIPTSLFIICFISAIFIVCALKIYRLHKVIQKYNHSHIY